MKRIIVADSGSTKTDWAVVAPDGSVERFSTCGLNPSIQQAAQIEDCLKNELNPALMEPAPTSVFFYGAGCRGEAVATMEKVLGSVFRSGHTEVCSDLLGAARALCGNREGIACIIGTGSNSCLYDGKGIMQNVSPLGFILGDEGSGAVLGKKLLGNILKQQMSAETTRKFAETYRTDLDTIIRNVYREPAPNRYLASFVPFIHENRNSLDVRELILEEFHLFFKRNIDCYGRHDLPVHFIGSVAHYFADELAEAARQSGYGIGTIRQSPMEGLLAFHGQQYP